MEKSSMMHAAARCGLVPATVLLLSVAATAAAAPGLSYWPQWRGPLLTGAAPEADPPASWSETNHIKWKVKLPGYGTSTPIVWEDRVFVLTAVSTGQKAESGPGADGKAGKAAEVYKFLVLCYSRANGQLLWQQVAREAAPHEGHHPDHGFASASPVTDGHHLLAYFGSRGLHCYDLQGKHQWSKDLGRMQTRNSFGEGSSPALYGNTVVVYWDDESDNDFIAALDKTTGKELWRTPRNEPTGWSTPLMVGHPFATQAVVNATGSVRSYDLFSGKEIWSCAGQTANAIPTPVASADTVYVTSGFRGSALFALALGHTGDLTGTAAVRWTHLKSTPYVPSPLLVDGYLYLATGNNAVLSCLEAETGRACFEGEKLEGLSGIYASPTSAKDRVYVMGRNGVCLVLRKGPKYEVLASNRLDDKFDASLALTGKEIFARGHQSLYCISE